MIKVISKDLFETDAKFVLHQVNCQGVMGAGIAKVVRSDIRGADYVDYQHICSFYKDKALGHVQIVPSKSTYRYYVNCFAQDKYGRDRRYTDYEAFRKCLQTFKMFANVSRLDKIAIPYGIGCGLAGGDWNVVYKIICEELGTYNVEICRK